MNKQLIIDDNTVYEVDLDCISENNGSEEENSEIGYNNNSRISGNKLKAEVIEEMNYVKNTVDTGKWLFLLLSIRSSRHHLFQICFLGLDQNR